MIDDMASKIARMEHEERVRKLAPVYDEAWLKVEAYNWQAWRMAKFYSSLASGLASLANRLKPDPDGASHEPALQLSPLSGTTTTTVVK